MATSGKKTTKKNTSTAKRTRSASSTAKSTRTTRAKAASSRAVEQRSPAFSRDIQLLILFAVCMLLFLSLIGHAGALGRVLSGLLFGLFGLPAFAFPFLLAYLVIFLMANRWNSLVAGRVIGLGGLYVFTCAFFHLILYGYEKGIGASALYKECSAEHSGGGLFGGLLVKLFGSLLGTVGAYVIVLIALVIFAILLTQKPLLSALRRQSERAYSSAQVMRRDRALERKQRRETNRKLRERDKEVKALREANVRAVHERSSHIPPLVVPQNLKEEARIKEEARRIRELTIDEPEEPTFDIPDDIIINTSVPSGSSEHFTFVERRSEPEVPFEEGEPDGIPEAFPRPSAAPHSGFPAPSEKTTSVAKPAASKTSAGTVAERTAPDNGVEETKEASQELMKAVRKGRPSVGEIEEIEIPEEEESEPYVFPPTSLLDLPGKGQQGDSNQHLKETAAKLQQTLHNFGVEVTINHISCGPTVTRYELTPQHGVKVSKILSLQDDIKLNLAAADIRIEAPIPGKSAIGIEVPNKTNMSVMLRELLETQAFRRHKSPLAFTVGKDIAGQPIIADIGKMPHLLIAGATNSGKSVCINTLIMSILYKSTPEEVKFIMIDPKVVELSVYNNIPHLFIPVVTDPKKAAGALHWAVQEMTERYQKLAELGVRDLAGYNARVESMPEPEEGPRPKKMPRLVIIVDELADLMMVAKNEVEDSICRLAQLARAAGIHLIIATQRPSVNVITGLIKANMPSRIALAVTSGVDSRTILDMNGAEKLLGKGDMLFYPQGYQKPARVQGAFVSDEEILKVVRFLLNNHKKRQYDEETLKQIDQVSIADGGGGMFQDNGDQDEYFTDAGKLIIEKDKASIGMLQRAFRIGFNRAARIMDQLCDAGVVGEEEGTKPRKILMSMEQFENYLEGNG